MSDDEPDPRLATALARHQLVSAYIADDHPHGRRSARLAEIVSRSWLGPDGEPMAVAPETLRKWIRAYRRHGFAGLFDKERPRTGVRALPEDARKRAVELKQAVPERSLERIIAILEDEGLVAIGVVARSTVHRVLAAAGVSARGAAVADRHDLDRFEAAAPNDLWQSDMLCGPWLPDPDRPGTYRRAWMSAFLDDHSRRVLAGRFDFREDLPALERVFREALMRCGVPRRVYYDNGAVYRAHHMRQINAVVGIHGMAFTRPRRPMGHGKIEAFNRHVRRDFLSEVRAAKLTTLEQLNDAFRAWLDQIYHRSIHSETGQTPLERWSARNVVWVDEGKLREAFQWRLRRTADKAGVLSLHGVRYQVGPALARKRLELRYDPDALDVVEAWLDGRFQERARPLNIEAWRRPVVHTTPAEAPDPGDFLGRLTGRHKAEQPAPPTPVPDDPADDLLDLLRDHVDASVLDETLVRDAVARFGPFDLERAAEVLDRLAARHPRDLHTRFWLDALTVEAR